MQVRLAGGDPGNEPDFGVGTAHSQAIDELAAYKEANAAILGKDLGALPHESGFKGGRIMEFQHV